MTPDQLAWITEQNEYHAKRATRRTLKAAFVGYLILFAGVLGMYLNGQHVGNEERQAIVASGRTVSVDGCNRDFRDKEDFIDLLTRLKQANSDAFKRLPPPLKADAQQRYEDSQDFYNDEIKTASAERPDCRKAAEVVTSDPNADVAKIVPLYPTPTPTPKGKG